MVLTVAVCRHLGVLFGADWHSIMAIRQLCTSICHINVSVLSMVQYTVGYVDYDLIVSWCLSSSPVYLLMRIRLIYYLLFIFAN